MNTTQVRVTLPSELQNFLQQKADTYGMSMSSYIKHLILDDVKDIAYPSYQASEKTEKAYKSAKQAEKKATLIQTSDVEDYLNDL